MTRPEGDDSTDVRYRALEALEVQPAGAAPVESLLAALTDANWRVRRLAAERLAKLAPVPALVERLVALLGQRGDPGGRNAAATVLSQLGAAVLPAMAALLAHPDPDQRKFAADILGELARAESVPWLVKCLEDADGNVRVAAAEALGHIATPPSLEALVGLLDAPEAVLRVCALEGLAQSGRAPALPRLTALLADQWTRSSAFRVLGLIEHPTAFSLLTRALASPVTRDAALSALGMRGKPVAVAFEADVRAVLRAMPDASAWLTRSLEADSVERRLGALFATRALNEPTLALHVARAVRPGVTAEVALRVLVQLGVRGARMLVSSPSTLAELSSSARAVVGEALVLLSEPSLVTPLVAVLRAQDAELAELAIRALGRSRARTAIAPLLACLDHEGLGLHAGRALVSLAESWPAEVREALEPLVRRRAPPCVVTTWAEVVGEEALEALQRAMNDEDEEVRAAAASVASAVPTHAPLLVRAALMDESALVRRAGAKTLARLDAHEGPPLVAHALEDTDGPVLAFAARAAGALLCVNVRARLMVLSRHADAHVALSALDALSLLGGLDDDVLAGAARHTDVEVLKQVFALSADRPATVRLARASLSHAQWDVRVAAGRVLAVAGAPEDLVSLHGAAARESDPVAREALDQLSRHAT